MKKETVAELNVKWAVDTAAFSQGMSSVGAMLRRSREQVAGFTQAAKEGSQKISQMGQNAAQSLRNMNGATSSATNGLSSMIRRVALAAGAYFSLGQAVNYARGGIKRAMDVFESDSLFKTSLGKFTESTVAWADGLQKALGVSAFEARRTVGIWYTMTKAMGLADTQALAMAKSLVQLKYDLMSFYNIPDEQAETIIRAMISGETEPAKKIGILLTEEQAKRQLLTEGIIRQGQEVDSTTMMYGRYLAMMNQASTAHGDMARTIDSPANQLRLMQEELKRASLALGQAFLPIIQAVLPGLQYLAAFIRLVSNSLASLFGGKKHTAVDLVGGGADEKMGGIKAGLGGVNADVDSGADGWKKYGDAAEKGAGRAANAINELKRQVYGFDRINKLDEPTPNRAGGGGGGRVGGGGGIDTSAFNIGVDDVAAGLSKWADKAGEVEKKVRGFIDMMKYSPLKTFGTHIYNFFKGIYENILKPLGSWLIQNSAFTVGALEGIIAGVVAFKVFMSGARLVATLGGLTGGIGLAVASLVGLGVAVAGFLSARWEMKKLDDLNKRFGDLSLTAEQVGASVNALYSRFNVGLTAKTLEQISTVRKNYQDWGKELVNMTSQLYTYTLGVKFDESERVKFLADYDDLIKRGEEIAKKGAESTMMLFSSIPNLPKELSQALLKGENQLVSDFSATGKRLREYLNNAMADGEISTQEMDVINNLRQELNTMLAQAADAKNLAQLEVLWQPNIKVDHETFTRLLDEASTKMKEILNSDREAKVEMLARIKVNPELQADPAKREQLEKRIDTYFNARQMQITATNISFALGNMDKAFKDVKEKFAANFQSHFSVSGLFGNIKSDGAALKSFFQRMFPTDFASASIADVTATLKSTFESALNYSFSKVGVSAEARANLKDSYEKLIPAKNELQGMYDKAVAMGESVPEGIAEGLAATRYYGMMAGKIEDLWYMLGAQMKGSPNAAEFMETAKLQGGTYYENIKQGFESNVDVAKFAAEDGIKQIALSLEKAGVDAKTISRTLGAEIAGEMNIALQNGTPALNQAAENMMKGVAATIELNGKGTSAAFKAWFVQNQDMIVTRTADFQRQGKSLAEAFLMSYASMIDTNDVAQVATLKFLQSNPDKMNSFLSIYMSSSSELSRAIIDTFKARFGEGVPAELISWLAMSGEQLKAWIQPYAQSGQDLPQAVLKAFGDNFKGDTVTKERINSWGASNADVIRSLTPKLQSAFSDLAGSAQDTFSSRMRDMRFRINAEIDEPSSFRPGMNNIGKIRMTPYASGGFPSVGEVFLAREAGAELVGSIGGRPAVANNDQIVAAVSAGVFEAVRSALGVLGGQRGDTIVPVYIGGEKIHEAVIRGAERANIRAGRTVMSVVG